MSEQVERNLRRGIAFLTVILMLSALLSSAAAVILISRLTRKTLVYSNYSTSVPTSGLCPGETFDLAVHIQVYNSPAIVAIAESWWSEAAGYNVILSDNPHYSVVTQPEDFTRVITIQVPSLPAGHYQYRRAAQDDGSPVEAFAVPVLVRENCK